MEELRITLETLYDILRNEKKREDLQKLASTFFADAASYLREKKSLLNLKKEESEFSATGEKEKLESELRNIKRILREIYEKREKKIMEIALNRSKTGSDLVDTSAMLPEEKELYSRLLNVLDCFRRGILTNLSKGELPLIALENKSLVEEKKEQLKKELEFQSLDKFARTESNESASADKAELKPEEAKKEAVSRSRIRFIRPLPSFVWTDMKVYGPYDIGEEVEIFTEVAELIVRKGRAEKV